MCDNYSAKKDIFILIYLLFYIRVEQVIQISREANKVFWVKAGHIASFVIRSEGDI